MGIVYKQISLFTKSSCGTPRQGNPMIQGVSGKAKSYSAGQEIHCSYGTRRVIIISTKDRYSIVIRQLNPVSTLTPSLLRCTLILFCYLRLSLPSDIVHSVSPKKVIYEDG
jgi:hypothetical protein